jgi:SAM-dependent methyltransferase
MILDRLFRKRTSAAPVIRDGVTRIDIGCGLWKEEGYFGLDTFAGAQVDHVLDLTKDPLPFSDNSIDHAVSYHCLEHLWNFERVVGEVWRVLKPDHQFFVCLPYFNQHANFANFFHVRQFNEHSFRFFSSEPDTEALDPKLWKYHFMPDWGLKGSANAAPQTEFRTCKIEFDYYPEHRDWPPAEQERLRLTQPNVVHNICFTLQALKPGSEPRRLGPDELIVPGKRQWMLDRNW